MPTYEYFCNKCQHEFDEILKIDERDAPTKSPCPKCGQSESIEQKMSAPAVVADGTRLFFHKKMDGKLKERLQEIKRKNPGSTVKV